MRIHSRLSVILFISCTLFVKSSSSRCSKDEDCRLHPFQRCCKRDFSCKTKWKCVLPCMTDRECPAGNQCVHNLCITTRTTKLPSKESSVPCYSDRDCFNSARMPRCCRGYCTRKYFCLLTTTPTVLHTKATWCKSSKNCASGETCEGGKCKYRSDNIPSSKDTGFLSAAIITSSLFLLLLLLCCRFVQEGSRRSFFQRRRRSRNRSRSRQRRSIHHTTAEANGGFIAEGHLQPEGAFAIALPEYPRDLTAPDATDTSFQLGEQNTKHYCSPPPYSTLSFELPPSYNEVVQTRVSANSVQTRDRSV